MEDSACLFFSALKICAGDIVVIELTTRDVIKGVVADVGKGKRFGFIALAPDCDSEAAEAVSIRRVVRVIKVGECRGSSRSSGRAEY